MYRKGFVSIFPIFLFFIVFSVNAQITAVPFLLNAPDARTGAMGDAGVALSADANSLSNNPSKLAFIKQGYGFSASYNPWLKSLVADMNLGYLSGFYKISDRNTIGASLRYFSLGKVQLLGNNQEDLGLYSPNEFAIDGTFARRYGESFSMATSLRYIRSNMGSGLAFSGNEITAGTALAVDVSLYFKQEAHLLGTKAIMAAGAYVSNLGTKLSYTAGTIPYFLPTNLKLGVASTFLLDADSELSFALDFNKLLVPTEADSLNAAEDTSVPKGIFGSFVDAPGGFKEEFKEISLGAGVEYLYKQQFALRGGYSYAHPLKGNKNYFSLGAGFNHGILGLDVAYIMASQDKNPMANSLRVTLLFNFRDVAE